MSKVEESTLQFWRDKIAVESHYTNYKAVPGRYRDRIDALVLERYASECCQATIEDYKEKLKAEIEKRELSSGNADFCHGLSVVEDLIDSIK